MSNSPRRRWRTVSPFTVQRLGDPPQARAGRLVRRGGALTGKRAVVAQLALALFLQGKRVLLATRSNTCPNETVTRVLMLGVPVRCVFQLGRGGEEGVAGDEFGKCGLVKKGV